VEKYRPDCIRKTVKCSTKIMVWGDISMHGISGLFIVEGTMNEKNAHQGNKFTF